MTVWIVVVTAGIACFALRLLPAVLAGRRTLPGRVHAALDHVGPAAFAALAAPAVLTPDGAAAPLVGRLLAVAVTLVVARRVHSTAAAVAAGLPVLWLATALLA